MTTEDARERHQHEAQQHALLVEGVAMALRAKPDAILRYTADWRKAEWLLPDSEQLASPEPPFNLLTDPYFAGEALAAAQPLSAVARPEASSAKTVPVYRVRKATDAR